MRTLSDKLLWWILPFTTATVGVFCDVSSREIVETKALLPKVAGSTFIRNVAMFIIDSTASHSRILSVFIVTAVKSPSLPHLVNDTEHRMGQNWLMHSVSLLNPLTL
jgi:hypothetical protein